MAKTSPNASHNAKSFFSKQIAGLIKGLHSLELTYPLVPLLKALLKMMFLFPRWNMSVSGRVILLEPHCFFSILSPTCFSDSTDTLQHPSHNDWNHRPGTGTWRIIPVSKFQESDNTPGYRTPVRQSPVCQS